MISSEDYEKKIIDCEPINKDCKDCPNRVDCYHYYGIHPDT